MGMPNLEMCSKINVQASMHIGAVIVFCYQNITVGNRFFFISHCKFISGSQCSTWGEKYHNLPPNTFFNT